jgi:uncharacterized YkwD family protein/spore coat assembly protein SafA
MKQRSRLMKAALAGTILLAPLLGAGSALAYGYTVKSGDTMWKISVNHGVSLQSLIRANPQIANPNIIWRGMSINIPGQSAPAAKPATSLSSYAQQVANLVNQERVNNGLSPLKVDVSLSKMALDKGKDMYNNNYFDHQSPTYGSPFDMMNSYGISYSYAGENIAQGQRNPQEVMNAWMNSAGHRENILNANYKKIGVAYYNGEWVQEFIG